MRIHDRDTSFTSGQNKKESQRQRAFRTTYKVGDLLSGIIEEYQGDARAWVIIGDLRVLAEVANTHPLGSRIYLVVTALHPAIILQEADQRLIRESQGLHLIV